MKTKNLLTIALIASAVAIFSSCSEDDDHADDGCQHCHIALPLAGGGEHAWEIKNAAGGDEFCGDELADAESNTYVYTVVDPLFCTLGEDTLPPGEYGPGSANSQYEIHCEEDPNAHNH